MLVIIITYLKIGPYVAVAVHVVFKELPIQLRCEVPDLVVHVHHPRNNSTEGRDTVVT